MATAFMDKDALIDWAVTVLAAEGALLTYDAILTKLEPVPEAIKYEFRRWPQLWTLGGCIKVSESVHTANLAIADVKRRKAAYRRRMRQLFEIAVPKAYAAGSDDGAVKASLSALHEFVAEVKITAVIATVAEERAVLSAIKKDWRMLGWDEARMWEPLYELVTGRELVNE
ncbi:MAG: hypothetical protein Q9205_007010 [Flavoplaca limonia]